MSLARRHRRAKTSERMWLSFRATPAAMGPEARLAAFYSEFPVRETLPGWLEKIYAAGNTAAE